jgi:hypothetical protein
MTSAKATACPPKYVMVDDVNHLRRWLRQFVTCVTCEGIDPIAAAMYCDEHHPLAAPHIRVRCEGIHFDAHARQERLVFGSLEKVHPHTVDAAGRIPFPLIKRIALEETRLRLAKDAYAGTQTVPSNSVEDNITKQALRTVIGGTPGANEVALYRVAVRLHASSLHDDVLFLRADRTIATVFLPGDVVPKKLLRNVRNDTSVTFGDTGAWLFVSAS